MAEVELLLLRHGIAEPRRGDLEDRLRALTPDGRDRTEKMCLRAQALGLTAQALFSSPLVRARQTGEIAVAAGLAPALECSEALAPGADPWALLQQCMDVAPAKAPRRLILVGHEPDLGLLACQLMAAPPGAVALKKAGIALIRCVEVSNPSSFPFRVRGQLLLLLTPRVLISP